MQIKITTGRTGHDRLLYMPVGTVLRLIRADMCSWALIHAPEVLATSPSWVMVEQDSYTKGNILSVVKEQSFEIHTLIASEGSIFVQVVNTYESEFKQAFAVCERVPMLEVYEVSDKKQPEIVQLSTQVGTGVAQIITGIAKIGFWGLKTTGTVLKTSGEYAKAAGKGMADHRNEKKNK